MVTYVTGIKSFLYILWNVSAIKGLKEMISFYISIKLVMYAYSVYSVVTLHTIF